MNYYDKFIDTLVREVAFRTPIGVLDLKNKEHISLLSEVLSEWGLTEIKDELISNLISEDEEKRFRNPALNRVVTYKDNNGNDKEGLVGNLLRLPKDEPGRVAAERTLPNDEESRKQIMKDLGAENAPKADSTPNTGNDADDEKKTADRGVFSGQSGDAYRANLPKSDPAHTPAQKEPKRVVAGKDKTLKKVNSLETEVFTQDLEPNDTEFAKKNEKLKLPIPPEPYKLPEGVRGKFPKKYLSVLERMMNTNPEKDGTKWFHYSNSPGGAGRISAQAGEIIAMMGVGMDDADFEKLTNSLYEHEKELVEKNPKLKHESTRIITKSWIDAAKNNREAILKRVAKEYPGAQISATAWDTKAEVESLGLENYNENKGFSTDVYVKLKLSDGTEILDEVSLKKSKDVNFLNSGTGKFSEWDDNLPDDINQAKYAETQRTELSNAVEGLMPVIKDIISSDGERAKNLKAIVSSKKVDFDTALADTKANKGSRGKSKILQEAIKAAANWPDFPSGKPQGGGEVVAIDYLNNVKERHIEYQRKAIDAISTNPKLKEGMLNEIRTEFPLKAVSEGEETMAIGNLSLDKSTMQEIFGTSDYDQIKEKLSAEPGPPPYIGYRAEVGDKVIPIAEVAIREDGVGYGGSIKFEMKLHKQFAKVLEDATNKVYN